MTTQIVIHIFPNEIDLFEWQLRQLKLGSYYLNKEDSIIIDVTLNLNLVDWSKSYIPKQFFINKFYSLQKICDWSQNIFIIDEQNKCLGCNDKRRQSIRTSTVDNIIFLDSDIFFRPELLACISEASKHVSDNYYVISPQLPKMWDETWDELVNENYIKLLPSIQLYENTDPFYVVTSAPKSNIIVRSINKFKFGGGWFNLFSTKLLKFIDIPDSLGSYGLDDTFVMVCCEYMRIKGLNINQYVLEGMIVTENVKYKYNSYDGFIAPINKQSYFKKIAEEAYQPELQNFINKLNE